MPNRILREGVLTSPRVAKLNWPDEVFYRRLMSVVDDFGRYYADPGMLRAACYPRQLSKVSDSDIEKWLACVQKAALVRVYEAQDSERYLELLDFRQQVRAKESKFPQMRSSCVADEQQKIANEHLDVVVSVDVSVTREDEAFFERFWSSYPNHSAKQNALKAWKKLKLKPDDQRIEAMRRALTLAKQSREWAKDGGEFIPHAATWLNGQRWEDELTPANIIPIGGMEAVTQSAQVAL